MVLIHSPEQEQYNDVSVEMFNNSTASTTSGNVSRFTTELYVVLAMLSVFCLLGTIENAIVLYIFGRRRQKLTVDMFIFTLAATDFLTCLVVVPFTITIKILDYRIQFDCLCKLYVFLLISNLAFSVFIMVAIAVDRYLHICHPFLMAMTNNRVKIIIAGLALLATTIGITACLLFGVYTKQTVSNISAQNESGFLDYDEYYVVYTGYCLYNALFFNIQFGYAYNTVYNSILLLSVLIVGVLYGMIYRSVLKSRRMRRKTDEQRQAHIKTACMLFVVTFVFVICYLPSILMEEGVLPVNIIAYYMYFMYNVINPVIYAYMLQTFRDDIRTLFKCEQTEDTTFGN